MAIVERAVAEWKRSAPPAAGQCVLDGYNPSGGDGMRDITYGDDGLPPDFPGGYVAWLDDDVLLTAETYGGLCERLDQMPVDQARVVIGYVDPPDVVRIGLDTFRLPAS